MLHSMYQTGSLRFKETWGKVDPNNNFRPVQGQTIFDYFRIASLGRRGKGDE